MYQPAHGKFRVENSSALLAELSAIVPATLVTIGGEGFETSVLPMLFEPGDGPHGALRGHLARPNMQWTSATAGGAASRAIAIFHGPDAYVSPSLYAEKARTGRVVPTWNYVVVVVHGTLVVHDDAAWLEAHVRALVDRHEAGRREPLVDRRRARRLHPGPGEGHRGPRAPDRSHRGEAEAQPEPPGGRRRPGGRGVRGGLADGAGRRHSHAGARSRSATLPPSRRRPGRVGPNQSRSERGTVRAART